MNSFVSVEEQDVQCEDLENLVFSASNLADCKLGTSKKGISFANITNKNLSGCSNSAAIITDDYLVCMTDGESNDSTESETDFGSDEKVDSNLGPPVTRSKIKLDSNISIDPKLIPVNVEDNSCNAVDIEYLPFETVLMNYPGEVDYLDLHDKFLNIDFGNSPNPFDSDNEVNSFDGFTDSNSSFEGFNETKSKIKSFNPSSKQISSLKKPKSNSKLAHSLSKEKQRPRSRSTEVVSRLKHNIYRPNRHSIDTQHLKSTEKKLKQTNKNISKESGVGKYNLSSIFGDYKVTPLSSKFKANNIKATKLDLSINSTSPGPSITQSRSVVGVASKSSKSLQNYSESVTSSFCSSAISKFKEKADDSIGAMQQKSKKEKLNVPMQNQEQNIIDCIDLFSHDSEEESFEGFHSTEIIPNIKEEVADSIKEEVTDSNEFIGNNCNNVGCTISWLESKQAKMIPQNINNGIVFELSEFAKKIAWEPEFVVDWIFRLKGFLDMKPTDDDMKKINSILKRRKALSINFAGKNLLKTKLSSFDNELLFLPSIENMKKEICDSSLITSYPKVQKLVSESKQKHFVKKKSNTEYKKDHIDIKENINIENKINEDQIKENINRENKIKENVNGENKIKEDEIKVRSSVQSSSDELIESTSISKIENSDEGNITETNNIKNLETNDHSDLNSSNTDLSDFSDTDLSNSINLKNDSFGGTPSNFSNAEHRVSGRIRKPTTKAQESYSLKYVSTPQSSNSTENQSPICDNSSEVLKTKLLHTFTDDGKEIGQYCSANDISIHVLNSVNESSYVITNGVVYELYNFFRERKASLTSLVHTLYRLKNIIFEKSQIIATMAKIHEIVKVTWKENINKNPNMPYEEFTLLVSANSEIKTKNKRDRATLSSDSEVIAEPLCKKQKRSCSSVFISKKISNKSESESESIIDSSKEFVGDLNSTKGCQGKITRGDIVFLYTNWLKKKMEGQSNVFVSDLSKDVEELINERNVECIRIPVGTLMSSSVQLFDEFRKLSRVNMLQAKMYLLDDWIEDIKSKLDCNVKKKSISEQSGEGNQGTEKSSKVKINKSIRPIENDKSKENISKESLCSSKEMVSKESLCSSKEKVSKETKSKVLKSALPNLADDFELDKIVGYRIVKIGEESITEYRIRWVGFTSKDDSWINESDLNCPDILDKFWEALKKQRALKGQPEPESSKRSVSALMQSTDSITSASKPPAVNNTPVKQHLSNNPTTIQKKSSVKENESVKAFIKGQENISPFFGRENGSQNFFNIMINSLKPDLVDYQHEEENSFIKRIKVNKGDILQIYDKWRFENQEHLLTGGNQKVDVNVLIARVKDLMEKKKVRNFNPSCIIDSCYRMALMRAKLKDSSKVKEYLAGDFLEFMQISQKHQDSVRSDYSSKLKKLKQSKSNIPSEYDKINANINTISNLERETLFMAKYLEENKHMRKESELEEKVSVLQKSLQVELKDKAHIENIRRQNSHFIKELEIFGIADNTMDELLNIALKIKM